MVNGTMIRQRAIGSDLDSMAYVDIRRRPAGATVTDNRRSAPSQTSVRPTVTARMASLVQTVRASTVTFAETRTKTVPLLRSHIVGQQVGVKTRPTAVVPVDGKQPICSSSANRDAIVRHKNNRKVIEINRDPSLFMRIHESSKVHIFGYRIRSKVLPSAFA